jgi:hypothetical protein
MMTEAAFLALGILALFGQWGWIALIIGFLVVTNLGTSAFLNSRTRVEFVDPADARKDKPGRWYPT